MDYVNLLIDGISVALDIAFNPNSASTYKLYSELTEKDLITPAFFIGCKTSKETPVVDKRFKVETEYVVIFTPNKNDAKPLFTMNVIGVKLFNTLNEIFVAGDTVGYRGKDMDYEIKDGLLFFNVKYEFDIFKLSDPVDTMLSKTTNIGVENGN